MAGCVAFGNDGRQTWLKDREMVAMVRGFRRGRGRIRGLGHIPSTGYELIATTRNFYGTVEWRKRAMKKSEGRGLYNGRIGTGLIPRSCPPIGTEDVLRHRHRRGDRRHKITRAAAKAG